MNELIDNFMSCEMNFWQRIIIMLCIKSACWYDSSVWRVKMLPCSAAASHNKRDSLPELIGELDKKAGPGFQHEFLIFFSLLNLFPQKFKAECSVSVLLHHAVEKLINELQDSNIGLFILLCSFTYENSINSLKV